MPFLKILTVLSEVIKNLTRQIVNPHVSVLKKYFGILPLFVDKETVKFYPFKDIKVNPAYTDFLLKIFF